MAAAYGRAIESGRYHAAKDICAGACRYTLFVTRLCVSLCLFRDLWVGVSIYVSSRVCGAAAIVWRGGGTVQGIISRCPGVGVKVVF